MYLIIHTIINLYSICAWCINNSTWRCSVGSYWSNSVAQFVNVRFAFFGCVALRHRAWCITARTLNPARRWATAVATCIRTPPSPPPFCVSHLGEALAGASFVFASRRIPRRFPAARDDWQAGRATPQCAVALHTNARASHAHYTMCVISEWLSNGRPPGTGGSGRTLGRAALIRFNCRAGRKTVAYNIFILTIITDAISNGFN